MKLSVSILNRIEVTFHTLIQCFSHFRKQMTPCLKQNSWRQGVELTLVKKFGKRVFFIHKKL